MIVGITNLTFVLAGKFVGRVQGGLILAVKLMVTKMEVEHYQTPDIPLYWLYFTAGKGYNRSSKRGRENPNGHLADKRCRNTRKPDCRRIEGRLVVLVPSAQALVPGNEKLREGFAVGHLPVESGHEYDSRLGSLLLHLSSIPVVSLGRQMQQL